MIAATTTPTQVHRSRVAPLPARAGVFGIGLAAYRTQFPGLRERLAR